VDGGDLDLGVVLPVSALLAHVLAPLERNAITFGPDSSPRTSPVTLAPFTVGLPMRHVAFVADEQDFVEGDLVARLLAVEVAQDDVTLATFVC
jgi:hypothetical protein